MNKPQVNTFIKNLGDTNQPLPHRTMTLIDVLAKAEAGDETCQKVAQEIFARLQSQASDQLSTERAKELKEIIEAIKGGPLRLGTFLHLQQLDENDVTQRALVSLDDGNLAYVAVPDQTKLSKFKLGQRVVLDSHGCILLYSVPDWLYSGVEARLERQIDDHHLEVTNNQDQKIVVIAGPEIMQEVAIKHLPAGSSVILGAGNRLAVKAVPRESKEEDNFRFLDRGLVPQINVERDIGCPHRVIADVALHVREEMTRPELRRRYKLRPCMTRLLLGPSGTGKTLAVQAIHRQMYDIMSEVTDTPVDQLPHQVFRFRNSQMLSMWLGESDKNADRLFDEVEKRAAQSYTNGAGKQFALPVLVVMEEAEGIGASRGHGHDQVYDRILTTILQRLDPNRHGLADRLIVFLSTSNVPHLVDPAFLRRIGGAIEHFGRLNRDAFIQVLEKHVQGLPAHGPSRSLARRWQAIIDELQTWLYAPGIDTGLVELSFHGSSRPQVKYHRDFLTGALIDRAVQEAATAAWQLELRPCRNKGVTREHLQQSLQRQVGGIVHQLCPENAALYLDLPEGSQVTQVRRLS